MEASGDTDGQTDPNLYVKSARVGFLPEHFRFHAWLTAEEFLRLHADLYHMLPRSRDRRVPELLELVGLYEHRTKKLGQYSKGMLQRIGLAQALLNEPELVILDEPTSGLDPVGRRLVRDIIRDLRQGGTTVFLNSHLLSEVEVTCDRVAFIKFAEELRISRLDALVDGEVELEIRARGITPEILVELQHWGQHLRVDDEHLRLTLADEDLLPEVNRYLVEAGIQVYALRPSLPSLEELFIQIVGVDGGL